MNELIQYVRDNQGHPIGVVVSVGKNQVGWSRKHKLDLWDRDKALMIARNRAVVGFKSKIPHDVRPIFSNMVDRSVRYYK
jgi:hypothetical protein